jgi:hypothetical protein
MSTATNKSQKNNQQTKTRKIKIKIELTMTNNGINSYHLSIKDRNLRVETNHNLQTNTGGSYGICPIDPLLLKLENKIEKSLKSLAKNYPPDKSCLESGNTGITG